MCSDLIHDEDKLEKYYFGERIAKVGTGRAQAQPISSSTLPTHSPYIAIAKLYDRRCNLKPPTAT